jgi:uncharacterized protein (TIGR03435 family)
MNVFLFPVRGFQREFLLVLAGSIALALSPSARFTAPQDPGTKTPLFEVASVKPGKSACLGMSVSSPPGRFSAQCTTLLGLLFNAYPIKPNITIPGMPGWGTSVLFDVDAKMDDETALALQKLPLEEQWIEKQRMLQALLADRFKLRIHHEISQRNVYDLVIAKSGFKLKAAPASEQRRGDAWGRGEIGMHPGSMPRLAFILSDLLDRNVLDKTGLSGNYEFDLKWTPDDQQSALDAGPTLFTAIEEQLGLKLVPAKGPVDTIVIDHVERPSEN